MGFREDNVGDACIERIVDEFPGQSIDFFGALRARVYDDMVKDFCANIGIENLGKRLVNSKDGDVSFDNPNMSLDNLLEYGNDFSTLYAPLIRDGRMEKFYWNPSREDRIGV